MANAGTLTGFFFLEKLWKKGQAYAQAFRQRPTKATMKGMIQMKMNEFLIDSFLRLTGRKVNYAFPGHAYH